MYDKLKADSLSRLIETSMGLRPPQKVLTGGQVLNVYTGRLENKEVALAEGRIAYIGSLEEGKVVAGNETEVIDVSGCVLVPGYIEPHAHPFQLYNPVTLAEKVLSTGTTTLISDNLHFFTGLEPSEQVDLQEELAKLPVHYFWWARWDPQTFLGEDPEGLFSYERVKQAMDLPNVLQGGELTDWVALLNRDASMLRWMCDAKQNGQRVEGHAPGASYRTLARLAAAGVTGDHESIDPDEVWRRLELGYMTTLRHSSLRPDVPVLIRGLMERADEVPWHRLMMTTDGPTPPYLREGFVDVMLRAAMEAGCDPIRAYQMVTINPAVYYGLDDRLGGLAPGRVADINVLQSLEDPTPVHVLAQGDWAVQDRKRVLAMPFVDWSAYEGLRVLSDWEVSPSELKLNDRAETIPVIRMINPVITKGAEEPVTPDIQSGCLPPEEDRLYVTLADRYGRWITKGLLTGFGRGIDGLASTYNGSGDLLLIGRDVEAMARAANRVLRDGGGISWDQGGNALFHLPLPLGGHMSLQPADMLIDQSEELIRLLKQHDHPFYDPIYTFLFLSSTHLPQVRLTSKGIMRVKDRQILAPSERLR
ncbi:adenine deaminase [Marinithermofilum abyssi]|uniref:adenine deaminase n=1 Tax=Marinithermofilum abyssi TaxID=1571185 RepID=A0A8J2VEG3_9BACL|nr:adenine deaminase C-terminal domain-containing protein [Marinithermofilum abyssi]GGE09729.1 adenine deaminase [Marinithermofilum abyssi]